MATQIELDQLYLDIAVRIAKMSKAKRRQVGCVLVKNNNIISFGWNGMPHGFQNCCELGDGSTNPEVLHAEFNVLAKLAKSTGNSEGSTMYLTVSPCYECAKLIIQSGVKRIIYLEEYRDVRPLDFLKKAKVKLEHWKS